jgi:hypothetical protein
MEKKHRVNQLIAVMIDFKEKNKYFKHWNVIFEETMKVILNHGTSEMINLMMVLLFSFDAQHALQYKFTAATCAIYFSSLDSSVNNQVFKRSMTQTKPLSEFKMNEDEWEEFKKNVTRSLDPTHRKIKLQNAKFRKRTFKNYDNRYLNH